MTDDARTYAIGQGNIKKKKIFANVSQRDTYYSYYTELLFANYVFDIGFSTAPTTWLPVHPNYVTVNLEAQKRARRSHYELYRRLAILRQSPPFQYGTFHPLALTKYVFAFTRYARVFVDFNYKNYILYYTP